MGRRATRYEVIPFRLERTATADTIRWARKRLAIPVLLEIDVTAARATIRADRRHIAVFREVDVAVAIERTVGDDGAQETVAMPVVVRDAGSKRPADIHDEIRRAQTAPVPSTSGIGSATSATATGRCSMTVMASGFQLSSSE